MEQQLVEGFRLSPQQERLWRLQKGSSAFRTGCSVLVEGPLDASALRDALRRVVNRHEILRTAFRLLPGMDVPLQVIVDEAEFASDEIDLSSARGDEQERLIEQRVRDEAEREFDYERGEVVRASLIVLAAERHLLALSLPSLCADAWTIKNLVGELARTYTACLKGERPFGEVVQYADFSEWQHELLESEAAAAGREFWELEQLVTPPMPLLPCESGDADATAYRPESVTVEVEAGVARRLEALAAQESSTTATALLACWQSLLWRLTAEPEVVVQTGFDRGKYDDLHESLGLFTKYLPLRCQFDENVSFRDVIKRTDAFSRSVYRWQEYFSCETSDEVTGYHQSSPIGFEYEELPAAVQGDGMCWRLDSLTACVEPFRLRLSAVADSGALRLSFHYDAARFDREAISRFAEQYLTLLRAAVDSPGSPVGAQPLLGESERRQLLEQWQGERVEFAHDRCLHQLIGEQAALHPDRAAVVYEDQELSFAELNARANQLARHLRESGVGTDTLVGIMMERSVEAVVALLGVLKAGGAYLPLDPAYPHERISFMLADADAPILLTQSHLLGGLPELRAQVIALDAEWETISRQGVDDLSNVATPSDLAYVIYTSGSTGKPKGVMIRHRSVLNLLEALERAVYSRHPGLERVSVNAPLSFDASVKQVIQLARGRTLCVVPESARRDGVELRQYVERHGVEVLDCTPAQLRLLEAAGPAPDSLSADSPHYPRVALVGGEAIDAQLWGRLASDERTTYYNVYGPTECTVDVTCAQVSPRHATPVIGRALGNVKVFVLDARGQLAPVGVAGELCVGGEGVARGYLRRPELTEEKFIPDPFSSEEGARLYRTGDLVKMLPGGELEYVGRTDRQLKLRGYRIELGEIEAAVVSHPSVRECAVLAREDEPGDVRLVAYVVVNEEAAIGGLQEYLKHRLPEYMLPTAFVEMTMLPLTRHGKVDWQALPAPDVNDGAERKGLQAPRTPAEEVLAGLWAEVLRVKEVGVDENFFELGGHSLLATQLMSRVREAFGVEVALRKLFEGPTVAELASHVETLLRGSGGVPAPPLTRVEGGERLSVSFAQQRLWFIDQLEPGNPFYNIPVAVRLSGALDAVALGRALSEVVRRHEVLRTHFAEVEGEPVQVVRPAEPLPLPLTDLSGMDEAEREAEARRMAVEEARTPFDLKSSPLVRGRLVRLSEEEHVTLLTMHHIASDGWSIGVLIKEVAALYEAYTQGLESPLPELELQYADYAAWQRGWLQGEALEQQLGYWRKQLGGNLPVLELPTDRPRPAVQTHRGRNISFALRPEVAAGVRELSRREGVTSFMTLLAGFQLLLSRYAGQEDVVVGTPIAGRNRRETESLIGFFVNTLALRTDLSGDPGFAELLRRVREVTLSAYAHQDVPFEKLVEELQPERSLSHSPLFQVMFSMQNAPAERMELPGLELRSVREEGTTAKFDLTVTAAESESGMRLSWNYNTDLFDVSTIERMARHFERVMEAAVESPQRSVSQIELLSEEERHQILVEWNRPRGEYASDLCLHELFEAQAAETPHAVAVIHDTEELSFSELNARANQLAHHLRARGVGADSLVGVLTERSIEMLVALLGVLKAGGAYVPLDPGYPQERLSFMLEDTGMRVLLTQQHLREALPEVRCEVIALDSQRELIAQQSEENLSGIASEENLAYIIYTSGSTGRPKGVAIAHRSAVTFLRWAGGLFPSEALSGVLAATSICFDLSIFELFLPLACGGRVIIARNALELPALKAAGQVTLLNTVPSAAAELVRGGGMPESVRTVNLAGEALPRALAEQLYDLPGVEKVFNLYGPSEDTTYSTFTLVGRGEVGAPSIGRPIAGTQVYLLDRRLEPVPVGVAGEVYIGGDGLARGYLGRPGLSAEKFVPDPFSSEPGGRMYRTGDLARYLACGEIDFLGRIDHQVKVRGFRIELGEIETALSAHPEVAECIVVAREEAGGDKRLVAYVVRKTEGHAPKVGELRAHLLKRLPEYMVPSAFVQLPQLPLTPNGKVDRRALPEPGASDGAEREDLRTPRTPAEEVLAGLWAEVLRVKEVGVDQNFFELGGHSLLATRLMSRVREAFGVEVALRKLFEGPTVAELASHVETLLRSAVARPAPPTARIEIGERRPVSFAQQRLWFIDQLEPGNAFYNIPVAVRLSGRLDVEALERALSEVVRRHEVLRTCFAEVEGEPVQAVCPAEPLPLPLTDLSGMDEAEREAESKRVTVEEARTPFDLARAPLVRGRLVRLSEEEHVTLLTMHHIASDGWSIGVLIKEVAALYTAFSLGEPSPLPELELQYADYAAWQRGWLEAGALEEQLGYWRKQLGGRLPVLELPTDRPRPAVQTHRGRSVSFALRPEVAEGVRRLSRGEGMTPFMTLLAAFQLLLSRYAGQEDIVVGTPIAGRNRREIEPLIGFFVNTLALRTDLSGDPSFKELLRRVREMTLSAYVHQDVPFEKLVEELQPERSMSHSPLFQVMFSMQNAPAEKMQLPGLRMKSVGRDGGTAKFDLMLTASESRRGGMRLSWNYNTDLFDASTIERMARHFEQVVEAAVESPQRRISEIELLSEEERYRLQMEWNRPRGEFASDLCIQELFEARAAETPDAVAVTCDGRELTYGELNTRANRLAHFLRERGVGADSLVGVLTERSVEMLVALLGVLKAGGAYVPLDPAYPQERLSFMLEDTGMRVLLTQRHLRELLPEHDVETCCIDGEADALVAYPCENPQNVSTPEGLAYVIYTSGSTGKPKGVMVTHANVARLLDATRDWFNFGRDDVWTMFHSYAFDFSVWEIWGALLYGGRVVVVPYMVSRSPEAFYELLRAEGVTVLNQTPSSFRQLMHVAESADPADKLSLRLVIFGGEALELQSLRPWFELYGDQMPQLVNMYGITETTVHVTYRPLSVADLREGTGSMIGTPIPDLQVYVLDEHQHLLPVGVRGELCVGGDGLARGYLNRPELTAQRFIPNPYSDKPGARLYRSGDLARYLPNGDLEYLGRIDHQVKIRGFRIELGEIETALTAHDSISECVVIVREDATGDKRLVAYVVGPEGCVLDGGEVREHLRERLPEYMVPSAFVQLPQLPLTPNGKVDRRGLPEPGDSSPNQESTFVAPRDVVELRLKQIWERVLGIQPVGVKDNFFELGGHSMLAVRLMSETQKSLGCSLPLATLFRQPTIEGLAALIRQEPDESGHSSLVEIQPEGTKRPFFCVHPVGGNVLCYYDLARLLGPDQPFYGLQSNWIDGRHAPDASVEAMAARYIQELRVVQPEGPYLLGGWSMGGVVAFEMAQQLRACGQAVDLLALFDSVPLGAGTNSFDDALVLRLFAADIAGKFDLDLEQLREQFGHLEVEEQLAELGKHARDNQSLPPDFDLPQVRHLLEGFRANLRALRGYEPKPYGGEVTLFPAEESTAEYARDEQRGWGALAAGGLSVHQLPGNHYTILNRPQVVSLSALLKKCIEAAGDARGLGALLGDLSREQAEGQAA